MLCLALLIIAFGTSCEEDGESGRHSREIQKERQRLDLTDPGSWEAAVTDQQARASRIAEGLMSVVRDKQRSDDDRRHAIGLLARLGDSQSAAFLVANIDMHLPLEKIKGDEDEIRQRPCTYVLSGIRSGIRNWNVVPLILAELRKPAACEKAKLTDFAFVLGSVCGERTARAIIEQELAVASDPTVKDNLRTVLKYI
jgi:hypothetical protein